MEEKNNELEKYFNKGCVLGFADSAFLFGYVYKNGQLDLKGNFLDFFIALFVITFLMSLLYAGVLYGLKNVKFKFSLNPIKLVISIYINFAIVIFFAIIYMIKFICTNIINVFSNIFNFIKGIVQKETV